MKKDDLNQLLYGLMDAHKANRVFTAMATQGDITQLSPLVKALYTGQKLTTRTVEPGGSVGNKENGKPWLREFAIVPKDTPRPPNPLRPNRSQSPTGYSLDELKGPLNEIVGLLTRMLNIWEHTPEPKRAEQPLINGLDSTINH